MTKCRCRHKVPWYRTCPWCTLSMDDAAWLLSYHNNTRFRYAVEVASEVLRWARCRFVG